MNGTWAEEAFGNLPSGIYSSVQPFELLLGCPLNGTWTVEICDSWAADNGFIFDWTVNFNPDLYPEIVTFTPEYEFDCNLNSWIGDDIISTSADCNEITVTSDEAGVYVYSYTVTDNFGCSYTHDVEVNVEDLPAVNASGNYDPCSQIATLTSSVTNTNQDFLPYSFNWDPADLVINPNAANTSTDPITETTTFNVTVFPSSIPECETTVEVEIVVDPETVLVVDVNEPSSPCPGDEVQLVATASGGFPGYTYTWSTGQNGAEITVSPMTTTTYTLTVEDECTEVTLDIEVEVSNPGTEIIAEDQTICAGIPFVISENISGGTGVYTFDLPAGFTQGNNSLTGLTPGIYVIDIVDNCIATGEIEIIVANCEVTIPNIISPNGDDVNDVFVIDGLEYLPGSNLRIWNRWGNLVYEAASYENNWEPSDVSEGVYYFELILPTNEIHTGHLTVVRK
jgi:gliding motility-associated-like protein